MDALFANRITNVKKSFIREIFKIIDTPGIISFAGGLPNPEFFPVEAVAAAASKVLANDGKRILQYSTSEGYLPLREYIAERYNKRGLDITPDEILITNGSQQGLDLLGKVFINEEDKILIESPGYLGAIQAFTIYRPTFVPVPLEDDGINLDLLTQALDEHDVKLFYAVPNFQNPSGISYSREKREKIASLLKERNLIFVEDDPYGDLRFMGEHLPSMHSYLEDNCVLLGSFSKVVAPGFRMGWICAKKDLMEKLIIAKQGSDLHSNYFTQRVLHQFLVDNDLDEHIEKIKEVYKKQRDLMVDLVTEHFPKEVKLTNPEGGMFLWATLPPNASSLELFDLAVKEKVAFVPGSPFYVDDTGNNTMRLNFSNSDPEKIEIGVQRLAKVIKDYLATLK